MESNYSKDPPVSDYNAETKDTKYQFTNTDSISDQFDNFHEDLDNDNKLSPEDKLNIEEYNEQMIPNPNFYKINNEMHVNNEQISKDHDTFRNELGFSPLLSKYPSSVTDNQVYSHIENDYGNENENNVQHQDSKKKRNTRNFDASKTNSNRVYYSHLNDQEDTSKNDLSHEADYKLSKNEQDSQNTPQKETAKDSQLDQESQIEQRPQNEFKNSFENEFKNERMPQNTVSNTHASESVSNYNNFQDFDRINKPITDSNTNSHMIKAGSKPNFLPKKQTYDSKSQKYLTKHGKYNQITNEINLKISNRMMSKGLGPSLPSQSVNYYPNVYRHSMNIDVENQNWKERRNENRNDLTDYVGRQRRLLQFDYEESTNDYPLNENNAPNEKNLLKTNFLKTMNDKQMSKNGEISESVPNTNEKRNLKESGTTPVNSTARKLDDTKIGEISQTNVNQSGSNNTMHTILQKDIASSNSTTKEEISANDHGKIVKRSVSYGKQFGVQE